MVSLFSMYEFIKISPVGIVDRVSGLSVSVKNLDLVHLVEVIEV